MLKSLFKKKPKNPSPHIDTQSVYLFTSFRELEALHEALEGFALKANGETLTLAEYGMSIRDGDDYFLEQRDGMLNFYTQLAQADHKPVYDKFLGHLSTCVKAYKINFDDQAATTPVINALVEGLSGLVFSPSMAFYLNDWRLIIDAEGNNEVDDYTVQMSSKTFDEHIVSTAESEARKQRSIDAISTRGIATIEHLPTVPDSTQVSLRSTEVVARRALTLAAVAIKGELRHSEVSFEILERFGIQPEDASPIERAFLQDEAPEEQAFINAIWRYESCNIMMWALGLMEDLPFPETIVDVESLSHAVRDADNMAEFLATTQPRALPEVLEQLDLTYRLHWACVDARINNKTLDAVDSSVVFERHYALNWLVDLYGEPWDDVSTPT